MTIELPAGLPRWAEPKLLERWAHEGRSALDEAQVLRALSVLGRLLRASTLSPVEQRGIRALAATLDARDAGLLLLGFEAGEDEAAGLRAQLDGALAADEAASTAVALAEAIDENASALRVAAVAALERARAGTPLSPVDDLLHHLRAEALRWFERLAADESELSELLGAALARVESRPLPDTLRAVLGADDDDFWLRAIHPDLVALRRVRRPAAVRLAASADEPVRLSSEDGACQVNLLEKPGGAQVVAELPETAVAPFCIAWFEGDELRTAPLVRGDDGLLTGAAPASLLEAKERALEAGEARWVLISER